MINWYQLTKKYNNIPYKLGGWTREEGLDCLSLFICVLEDMGFNIESLRKDFILEYKGKKIDSNNYSTELKTKAELMYCLIKFVQKVGRQVNKMVKGDVVIFESANETIVALYTGQGSFLTSFELLGSRIVRPRDYKIMEIYRWQQQSLS
jgi:cell wall-associated NlpC family hydrolase